MLTVDISLDGNQWCAIIGNMPEELAIGFGDTIGDALRELAKEMDAYQDGIPTARSFVPVVVYVNRCITGCRICGVTYAFCIPRKADDDLCPGCRREKKERNL